jgi:hypothetical protein
LRDEMAGEFSDELVTADDSVELRALLEGGRTALDEEV